MLTTRTVIGLSMAATVCLSAGCVLFPRKPVDNKDINPPPVVARKADPASLVNYLNKNAELVSAVQAQVDLQCNQGSKTVGVSAVMACRKDKDFRLRGKVLGMDEVDLGSNAERFWFWVKRANPPHLYHCTHKDLAGGKVNVPFPFQADMVLIALGMAEYDPKASYDLKEGPRTLELTTDVVSPKGDKIKRTVVFNRAVTRSPEPQVIAHVLKTPEGKVICEARVEKVHTDRDTGASVPSKLKLSWPGQEMSVGMQLWDVKVNRVTKEDAARLFTMTAIPGVDTYDLARGGPSSALRSAGYYPR